MQTKKWAALGVTSFALALFVGTALAASASEPTDEGGYKCDYRTQTEEWRENRAEAREEIVALFEAGDYEAWAEFMANKPMADELVTEANFQVFVEAHELMQAGDREGARELLESNGIKPPHKHRGPGQKGPAFKGE